MSFEYSSKIKGSDQLKLKEIELQIRACGDFYKVKKVETTNHSTTFYVNFIPDNQSNWEEDALITIGDQQVYLVIHSAKTMQRQKLVECIENAFSNTGNSITLEEE
jgi:hypothetical protein